MKRFAVLVLVGMTLSGCSSLFGYAGPRNHLVAGAVVGSVAGALIGGLATGTGAGALVGAGIGAAAGAAVATITP
jgi:hypothetical protein